MAKTELQAVSADEGDKLSASGVPEAVFSAVLLHRSSAVPFVTVGQIMEHYSIIPPEIHWSQS